MKKLIILSILFCFAFKAESQTNLNDYKYVVVPLQYEFLKGQNTHRLNTLTKVLFKQGGFDVHFEKAELPEDLFENRCLALYADVHKVRGGFRKTRFEITLKDCHGELVLKSDVGQSGENNHEKRHQMALREAFNSIKKLNYKYQPIEKEVTEDEVTEEIEEVTKEEVVEEIEEVEVKEVLTTEMKTIDPIVKKEKVPVKKISQVLYATQIDNGYQINDEDKKSIMVLLNTAVKNVFIVKGKDAIVFKENDKWMYSENNGTSTALKELNIEF